MSPTENDAQMPMECDSALAEFVSAAHAALRIGVYAGELRRRFEAAVVEETILPSTGEIETASESAVGEDPATAGEWQATRDWIEALRKQTPCRCSGGFICSPCKWRQRRNELHANFLSAERRNEDSAAIAAWPIDAIRDVGNLVAYVRELLHERAAALDDARRTFERLAEGPSEAPRG